MNSYLQKIRNGEPITCVDGAPANDQACEELKTLVGQRVKDGLAGKVSAKSVDEILDEELKWRPR